jgi:hypothetical protein
MKKKRFSEGQIVRILGAAEATIIEAMARQYGGLEQSTYRWELKFGHIEVADVRELCQLRKENASLKKVLV